MNKKVILILLSILLILNVFGIKVTLVTDVGGLGDKSYNDGIWKGVQRAVQELENVEGNIIISKEQTDYNQNLSRAAEISDVVIGAGFLMADALFKVALQYPDTHCL